MKNKKPESFQKREDVEFAASVLIAAGIHLSVPGWYNVETPKDARLFAEDPEAFYAKVTA